MTEFVFRTDSYLRTLEAVVREVTPEGARWVDARDSDDSAATRWQK